MSPKTISGTYLYAKLKRLGQQALYSLTTRILNMEEDPLYNTSNSLCRFVPLTTLSRIEQTVPLIQVRVRRDEHHQAEPEDRRYRGRDLQGEAQDQKVCRRPGRDLRRYAHQLLRTGNIR
jgi:hypothetical protein